MKKIEAANNYVLVKEVEDTKEMKTTSGIVLNNGNNDKHAYYGITGVVVSISKGCDRKILNGIKEGDKILFNKHEAVPFRFEGGEEAQAILANWIIGKISG